MFWFKKLRFLHFRLLLYDVLLCRCLQSTFWSLRYIFLDFWKHSANSSFECHSNLSIILCNLVSNDFVVVDVELNAFRMFDFIDVIDWNKFFIFISCLLIKLFAFNDQKELFVKCSITHKTNHNFLGLLFQIKHTLNYLFCAIFNMKTVFSH